MSIAKGEICLVTVTSESFIPGTLVMLHSFLKYNPWFANANHAIVIIHDAVSPQSQQRFNCYKNITWLQVGDALKERVDSLCKNLPHLKLEHRKKRFYSLELFRLNTHRKVLFCDSDLLFLGSIKELFQQDGQTRDLLCCGDLHYYTRTLLDAHTLMPADAHTSEILKNSFNAGFLVVAEHFLTPSHYQGLLDLLSIDRWNKIESSYTDQVVYNLYFKDSCRILDSRYNFLVLHAKIIVQKENIPPDEIKVVHFNGRAKPWNPMSVLDEVVFRPLMIPWINRWHREYLDFLPQYHLRSHFLNKATKRN